MTRPEKDEHEPAEPSAGEGPHGVDQCRRRKGRWLLSLMVRVFLTMAAQAYPGFAISDLDGVPVKVPRHLTKLLDEQLQTLSLPLLRQHSAPARGHQALRILQVNHALQSR